MATISSSVEPPQASGQRVSADRLAAMIAGAPRDERGRPRLVDAAFDAAVFTGEVSFEAVVFDGAAAFSQASFEGPVSFDGAEFLDTASFDRVTFRGPVSFDGARFGGTLWLNQASVRAGASFRQAVLERDATFDQTRFRGDLVFDDVTVRGDASFDKCRFASAASFERAMFRGGASFGLVIAAQEFDLADATFHGNAFFGKGSYRGEVRTDGASFARNPELPEALLEQRSEEPIDFIPRVMADAPADRDVLGFGPLLSALHSLLDDKSTELPLAIAITAPWGMGKSSVMRQLEKRLRDADSERHRTWATVTFAAWKFEKTERLWSALAKEIYSQPQEQMNWRQKFRFRTRLERRRLGRARFALKFAWPVVAAAAVVIALLVAGLSGPGTAVAGLASAAAVLSGVSRYWGAIGNPFKQAIDRYARKPVYKEVPGFTAEAERDIECLGDVLCPDDRHAVAVFVDDLDRCSHAHVVEVIEAINQIFASESGRPYVFILGLDREMVSTSISVAYRDTVEGLKGMNETRATGFGSQFLAKVVQMSLALPPPNEDRIQELLQPVHDGDDAATTKGGEGGAAGNGSGPHGVDGGGPGDDETKDYHLPPIRKVRDSDAVTSAESEALAHLEPNPRQVKRFHNAFRLQLYVAHEQPERQVEMSSDELHALAKWVAIRLRWPELADADDREGKLLTVLEAKANDYLDQMPQRETTVARLEKEHAKWFNDAVLLEVLQEDLPRRRISAIDREAFLRIA